MKKLLFLMVMVTGFTWTASAALQYVMQDVGDGGYIIKVTGGEGALLVGDQGGGRDRITNYTIGWYNYDADATANPAFSDVTWASLTEWVYPTAYQTPVYYLGEFKEGDEIGLYFVRNDDVNGIMTAATTGNWDDLEGRRTNETSGNPALAAQYYWSDMNFATAEDGLYIDHFFRYVTMPADAAAVINGPFTVGDQLTPPEGAGSGPSGQPLPGVLATIFLGGGLLGVIRRRKNRVV